MKPILIIDPGHGGKDSGGGSNQYWKEKDLVLKISLYQYERFKQLGVPVTLTRDKDVYLDSSKRTKIVRDSGAEYCISNHINAGGGDGVETIHSIYANDKLAVMLADAINKVGQNLRRVFTRTLPYDRKKDYYYMHRETGSVNTTIVEYGFADSKKDDVQQLLNDWKDYAESVVKAFCSHIGHGYVAPFEQKDDYAHELAKALEWAKENGISNGERLNEPCTRAQQTIMLYRFFNLVNTLNK
ncbi:N-acetylmuramoyl-L-alanine amidase [Cytobacillus sp. IB215665]|uniref:N-acetylmuramoyl-L-alanine amidase family protein n=1 Tax=Cytobacillus sp. IB215665 TaxID=3097357 RepID=UPI002A0C991B|nr:N-acetylmuramoyl-L-alanine amidase [Cytobacillus sp. IB215665]MDX8367868.1 N-acetylmuramoyl-L-alanine amidase [Cytobacillus sp. IB215665]